MPKQQTKIQNYWIMKSEPTEFSIDDLKKQKRARWGDIRNYQVRNMIRDVMKVGDCALFYHSNADIIGVVGEMRIIQSAYTDPTQFDSVSKYFDPQSQIQNPRWLAVNVQFVSELPKTVTLATIKQQPQFKNLPLVQKGNRLSVMRISPQHYDALVLLGQQ